MLKENDAEIDEMTVQIRVMIHKVVEEPALSFGNVLVLLRDMREAVGGGGGILRRRGTPEV